MASVKDLAYISDAIYNGNYYKQWSLDSMNAVLGVGFKAGLYIGDGGERVIAFAGTDDPIDALHDIDLVSGNVPKMAIEAVSFFDKVVGIVPSTIGSLRDLYARYADTPTYDDITVTGHSLGGALAAIVGNKYGLKTVTFNAPGVAGLHSSHFYNKGKWVASGVVQSIGLAQIDTTIKLTDVAEGKIHNYLVKGDIVSSFKNKIGENHWVYPISLEKNIFRVLLRNTLIMHTIEQWKREERYNSDGTLDLNNPINCV